MIGCILALLVAAAQAGKREAPPPPPPPPNLAAVLEEAGWTMTPERSSTFHAGDIYDLSSNSKVASRERCFDTSPEEGVYTSLHVVQAMQASSSVRLGLAEVKAGGQVYKIRTYAEPYVQEIPLLSQKIRQQCIDDLDGIDTTDMVLLTAVLSAEVKEENCRTLEARGQIMGNGASAGASQECRQESSGHVAIAYKTRALTELLTRSRRKPVAAKEDQEGAADALLRDAQAAAEGFHPERAREKLSELKRQYPNSTAATKNSKRLSDQLEVFGKPEPDWSVEHWLQGEAPKKGGTTLAVFWEPWCPHCKKEMPKLGQRYKSLRERGLQVVGFARLNRSTEEEARAFLANGAISFPVGKDGGQLAEHFNVTGIPAAALIRDGTVVWRGHPARLTEEVLSDFLDGGPTPTPEVDDEQIALGLWREASDALDVLDYDLARSHIAKIQKEYAHTRAARTAERAEEELDVIGKSAPSWDVETWFQGDLPKERVLVAVFWEAWCPHSRREVPALQGRVARWAEMGVGLVGFTKLTRDTTVERIEEFLEEGGIEYPMAKEQGSNLSDHFNVKGIPAVAVVRVGKWSGAATRHGSRTTC